MAISEEELKKIAKLAKLDYSACRDFAGEFEEIISFANTINSAIESDGAETEGAGGRQIPLSDLRADEVMESLAVEKVTSNVAAENGYFTVRRVVK